MELVERDELGRMQKTRMIGGQVIVEKDPGAKSTRLQDLLTKIFLPAGYPGSVSSDYLHYQIFNCLQAFSSSLAGLLASRAVLEGLGVGNADARATDALLLTILQDVSTRFTTILGAYYFGSSLYPEAKSYRLLADLLNDAAISLDVLSPLLDSPKVSLHVTLPFIGAASGIRVLALCLSASLRALCGIVAGGSKTALTVHFATPPNGTGDLGDLNAKDASKETVLALSGMLLGTLIVPYLTTAWSTYTALFVLLTSHLVANYLAVRGVVLRTLNRQRAGIAWARYVASDYTRVPTPSEVSLLERVFEWSGALRDAQTRKINGYCTLGTSISSILRNPISSDIPHLFRHERYLLWFDPCCLERVHGGVGQFVRGTPRLHICLKEGHAPLDHLKAWMHALEVGRASAKRRTPFGTAADEASSMIRASYLLIDESFQQFVELMKKERWNPNEGALLTGSPRTTISSISVGILGAGPEVWEDKKYS